MCVCVCSVVLPCPLQGRLQFLLLLLTHHAVQLLASFLLALHLVLFLFLLLPQEVFVLCVLCRVGLLALVVADCAQGAEQRCHLVVERVKCVFRDGTPFQLVAVWN